ncbi:MAG: hypothetical protein V1749_03665 [Candidatus Desantisbacteria bacterium]
MAKQDTPMFKPATAGDLIKADDWNTIQREERYALRYHRHRRDSTVTDNAYDSGSEDNAKQIETLDLADNAVTTAKIADGAVSELKIAANAVTELKIKDAAITSIKIADKSITDTHISDAKISESKLKLNFPTHDNSNDLTSAQKSGLTGAGDTNLHIHDGRYYQKSEIDPVITRIRHATMDSWVEGGNITYTGPINNVYRFELDLMCCIINGAEVNFPEKKIQVAAILEGGKYAVLATNNKEIRFIDTSAPSLRRWLCELMVYRKETDAIKYIPLYFFERKPGETVLSETDLRKGGMLDALTEAIEEIDRKFQDPIDGAKIMDGSITSAKLKIENLGVNGNLNVGKNLIVGGNIVLQNLSLASDNAKGNVGIGTMTPSFKNHITSDITMDGDITAGTSQLSVGGSEMVGKRMLLGYDTNGNGFGFIKAGNYGVTWTPLALQPNGGNVGIGTATPRTTLDVNGHLRVNGVFIAGGAKTGYVADQFINNLGEPLEQGDVIVLGKNQASLYYGLDNNIPIPEVDLTDIPYDTRICGIVAEISPIGMEEVPTEQGKGKKKKSKAEEEVFDKTKVGLNQKGLEVFDKTKVGPNQKGLMVTLGAYAHCKVDADIAAIEVGDLLTTSPTQRYAQKVLDKSQAVGAIIGKALAPLEKGKGKIPVLVMLQ